LVGLGCVVGLTGLAGLTGLTGLTGKKSSFPLRIETARFPSGGRSGRPFTSLSVLSPFSRVFTIEPPPRGSEAHWLFAVS
jgi:hypothetical protein